MQTPEKATGTVADASRGNWLDRYAPEWLKPYGRLARWDRPLAIAGCCSGRAASPWRWRRWPMPEPAASTVVGAHALFYIGSVA
jgi:hypothetical protein